MPRDACGIILAGGHGTRLAPATTPVSKQLLPVYDKPLIYYPVSTLMLSGIRDILVITRPDEESLFRQVLGDGSQWGIHFDYARQTSPTGLPDALRIGSDFISHRRVVLALGDNIFYGERLGQLIRRAVQSTAPATVFAYYVRDPSRYGVVGVDDNGRPLHLEEKPEVPRSPYAVTGLYVYEPAVTKEVRNLRPSAREELEITDLNRIYLDRNALSVELLGRGVAWFDAGTHDSLLDAANYVATLEKRQNLKVACPEEVAFRQSLIDADQLARSAERYANNDYGHYLQRLLEDRHRYLSLP